VERKLCYLTGTYTENCKMNTKIGIATARTWFILLLIGIPTCVIAQEDYEAAYNRLKAKIESELRQPPASTNDLNLYLSWMVIKAKDRDECEKLSYKAGRDGNPYWERKFFDLSDEADNSGESTKSDAMFKLMRLDDRSGQPGGYQQACYAAGPHVGERIYTTAIENGYITDDIRERARCMMRYATNDLEANWLYSNHESFLGHYDSEGFQVGPAGDWSITCMRRGEFTTTNQGDPLPPADNAMKMVQPVRDICKFYGLDPEFNDATDLMVQYLKEKKVLCLWPEEGHQWYIDLAQQYELDRAKEYMEGFYAIIKGKIEKEEKGVKKPVPDAEVEYTAPKDQRTWTTKSDQGGNYKIEGALLHKSCGPFILTANGDGCYKQEEVPGPLEEPDKSYELEKNLLLECGVEGYRGTITITKTWDYTKQYDDHTSTYTGSQTITINGTFKPIPEMEGMEGQPIKIFGKGTVYGTWKHNERRYCEGKGCGKCPGLVYDESGSGSVPKTSLDAIMITTNVWPTDNKVVSDQLKQFGMDNFYDIMIPGEAVDTQRRNRSDTADEGCQWSNSATFTTLTECSVRFKVTDIEHLQGRESWNSKSDSHGISVTNLTESIYDQPPYDPEQNGTDYTYTITWNLKAL